MYQERDRIYLGNRFPKVYFTLAESKVMALLVRGQTTKGIAQKLSISPCTVESHIRQMKIKLSCYTRAQLIDQVFDTSFMEWFQKAQTHADCH